MFYLNRQSIGMIHRIVSQYGANRVSQTNSRRNGNYCVAVRIYADPLDKKRGFFRRARTITTLADLRLASKPKAGRPCNAN